MKTKLPDKLHLWKIGQKWGRGGGEGWITRAGFYDVWTVKKDKDSKSLEVSGENDKEGQNKINYRAFYFSEASYRF